MTSAVTLGGLDAGAAMRLAANVIGAADLPAAVAVKVLAASEGNPLSSDRDLMIASARERGRSGGRLESRFVGAAGDRVAVSRVLWSGGPPEGRWEIEYLSVAEVDQAGSFTAFAFFDLDDARAAQREAWARWVAIDPAVAPWVALLNDAIDSFNAQDGKRLRALFADDIVVDDHRRTGFGRIESSPSAVVAST